MLILDTDHLSEIERGSASGGLVLRRLLQTQGSIATTIVTVEEQLRGWLGRINRQKDPLRQLPAYRSLSNFIIVCGQMQVWPMTNEAAAAFARYRSSGVRIGSMDLKIASIVVTIDATLLTRNTKDFEQVPGLRIENWL
jgi:tRNA(fMet)-specific endonuclease VapC